MCSELPRSLEVNILDARGPLAPDHRIADRLAESGTQLTKPALGTAGGSHDRLGDIKGIIEELPAQFNEATNRTIELIDVLWLKGNNIVAAFEVEHTTSIFSGLLRMSDLLALQRNLEIKLYLVGPDDRREKFFQEIKRPTFAIREKPLHTTCGFVPNSKLREYMDHITRLDLAGALQPKFLDKIADYFEDDDGKS